jgi:nitronate monooxygenase
MTEWPKVIQGGMGAGVSSWKLARAVSSRGQLGVVSGIALDVILVRRLQEGDPDGSLRRALPHFPLPAMANRILDRYFVPGGKAADEPYAPVPMHSTDSVRALLELCIVGNFVEVFLAREGHDRPVGINYLEKIQLPHLPSIYGAMLAGAAFVLMGAGIPTKIPGVLDRLARHEKATYDLTVTGAKEGEPTTLSFDPRDYVDIDLPPLQRPLFLSIISSNVLATTMLRRSNGSVDGFIVESPIAGGHNAPPRGKLTLDSEGQPVYGEKDSVDLGRIRELGKPFWIAGGTASSARLHEALELGAAGVQVGTAFAFCEESGLSANYRRELLRRSADGTARIQTDPLASPTGFPFKVAELDHSLSSLDAYAARERVCDLGFLREAYRKVDGTVGFRCPAEPFEQYVRKGGELDETAGRKCLCNALLANIGLGQLRHGSPELPLVTAGDDLRTIARFIPPGQTSYSAQDVIEQILGGPAPDA